MESDQAVGIFGREMTELVEGYCYAQLVAIGRSGRTDVAERADELLDS